MKLKKKIQLFETYVPDFYLADCGKNCEQTTVVFDADDSAALAYLCGKSESSSAEFTITKFFKELCSDYAFFAELIK